MLYFFIQVQTPAIIESQSNEVRLIYFFGSLIVLGLVAAITYLRIENNRKIEDLKAKDVLLDKKEAEKLKLIDRIHENEKANIEVYKDMISIIKQSNTSTVSLEKLIMQETNPNVKAILEKVKSLQ